MFHRKVRVRMIKSVEGLKIGGMYFLPKTFATELINRNCAAEVISIVPTVDDAKSIEPEVVAVAGPSSNKIVTPSSRKKRR